jgi:(1->4)-alpha-D-glucan 1-alpha-D-glucosylmutase
MMKSKMSIKTPLDRLAQLCGIELEYEDVWGKTHVVSDETKKALLEAMGFQIGDENQIYNLIAEYEAHRWRQVVDPVVVVSEKNTPVQISFRIPKDRVREKYEWLLTTEKGGKSCGLFTPEDCERKETHRINGEKFIRCILPLPIEPDIGYHQLDIHATSKDGLEIFSGNTRLIVTTESCYMPMGLEGNERVWGPSVQLYALRSQRNWGIGDFTDLRNLVEYCTDAGAGIIGLNPLHALFPMEPQCANPYRPSSRIFYNFLYLDIESIQNFPECATAQNAVQDPEFQARLAALRDHESVDYVEVAAAKKFILEILYHHFASNHLETDSERGRFFRDFQAHGGEILYRHSVFEALQEHFCQAKSNFKGWPDWPAPYQDPRSEAVEAFASSNQDRVQFFQYLQWQIDLQLGAAGYLALDRHFKVGLHQDLSIGTDPSGFETWFYQGIYALDASIGAPPDLFNVRGQDWELPPPIPWKMCEAAYDPIINAIRTNMKYAGAIRVDHVMGLQRLFWVPKGKTPSEGAYVHYPFYDLLGILAMESHRNQCMVVGEDLGTVTNSVRQGMEDYNILSCRLLYFEKEDDGTFKRPDAYPKRSLVSVTTHDLPTLTSYWQGHDLTVRTELGLFPSEKWRERQIVERYEDRIHLLYALKRENMLPEGIDIDAASLPDMTPDLILAIYSFLAASPGKIVAFQLEDVFGQVQQANLPGTNKGYPNWRQKLSVTLEEFQKNSSLESIVDAFRFHRNIGSVPATSVLSHRDSEALESFIPIATYRLQFNKDFGFSFAVKVVPFLRQLGISHCYTSPYLKALPGSTHGYDVVDHGKLNPELGSLDDFENFVNALQQQGMGQILDIVPNHMAAGTDNPWWTDVLENGQASRYAHYFDIAWEPLKDELRGKVLLPTLEDHYGLVLENGLLRLIFDPKKGEFKIQYYDHHFPLDPASYALILADSSGRLKSRLGGKNTHYLEFQSLSTAFENLPKHWEAHKEHIDIRTRDKQVHKNHLARLCQESDEIKQFLEENVAIFNGVVDDPVSYNRLDTLLHEQPFRLAYWRVAADDINYRRFFDINELASLRMENREVFEQTHRLVLDLIVQKKVQGLRIDHIDGLYDPRQYCQWLREEIEQQTYMASITAKQPTKMKSPPSENWIYLIVEKVLATHERLRPDWPVYGTTGYEFANVIGGLFVDAAREQEMDRIYTRFVGRKIDFDELLYDCKKLILKTAMASELNVLANQLNKIAEAHRHTRDYTVNNLRDALHEVIAWFPVYRTYVRKNSVTEEDRRFVEWAIRRAQSRSRAADTSVYDFIHRVLVLEAIDEIDNEHHKMMVDFTAKFQQVTGPVMAKGLEDTSFYIYNRLVSLNEVGGDPRRYGVSVKAFHIMNSEKSKLWPYSMLNTSTHDSKRSEDVRARIAVLSEIPDLWHKKISLWTRINRSKKRKIQGAFTPSKNDEYALYQNIIGSWPLQGQEKELAQFEERIVSYMIKAVKEAKVHSSWINPNSEYEDATTAFIRKLFKNDPGNRFLEDFIPFQQQVARLGMYNSLSQILLKLTAPGVPDIYQGNEIWNFALVDPDNRRPVDFSFRQNMLRDLENFVSVPDEQLAQRTHDLMDSMEDGRIKLYTIFKTLSMRWRYRDIFQNGSYLPVDVEGEKQDHLCAFARNNDKEMACITVVPRLLGQLLGIDLAQSLDNHSLWTDTYVKIPFVIKESQFKNIFTGENLRGEIKDNNTIIPANQLFANFPVALLTTP